MATRPKGNMAERATIVINLANHWGLKPRNWWFNWKPFWCDRRRPRWVMAAGPRGRSRPGRDRSQNRPDAGSDFGPGRQKRSRSSKPCARSKLGWVWRVEVFVEGGLGWCWRALLAADWPTPPAKVPKKPVKVEAWQNGAFKETGRRRFAVQIGQ